MQCLIIADHDNQTLNSATLSAITAGLGISASVDVLVAGHQCRDIALGLTTIAGVGQVLLCDDPACAAQLAENIAPLVRQQASAYTHILGPATTTGKNLLPRVAALLDVAQISEIIAVQSPDTFQRPIYAGNIIATVQSDDPIKVLTVRATAFPAAGGRQGEAAGIVEIGGAVDSGLSELVRNDPTISDRPDLASAEIVVSGGRGLGSKENFALVEQLADRLGAAIGASRAAVDAGFIGNDAQVGQTGKVVAPKLYIAVGISGAIQHLAGMKDSQVVVAINKDADAPIFQVANYGIVGDLFEIVPQLLRELDAGPGDR